MFVATFLPGGDLGRPRRPRPPCRPRAETCTDAARARHDIQSAVRRRLLDLAPPERAKLTGRLHDCRALDFAAFRAEVKRAFRAGIPVKQRGEWEAYLIDNAARVKTLSADIAAAECEIDVIVYNLFDLTPDEIALPEASLEGQYGELDGRAFHAGSSLLRAVAASHFAAGPFPPSSPAEPFENVQNRQGISWMGLDILGRARRPTS